MLHMVVLVLDDLDKSAAVLEAWEAAGVTGITILESTGLGRMKSRLTVRDDAPLMPSLAWLLQHREEQHRTIFTLVESDAMVDRLVDATQKITGDLDAPNRGILFVLPVARAVGLAPAEAT
jgi:nitrogen regulatory protein PII